GHAEPVRAEVADDRADTLRRAPAAGERLELAPRALAHEHVDVALAAQQPLDQEAPDEAGGAGHEVAHRSSIAKRSLNTSSMCGKGRVWSSVVETSRGARRASSWARAGGP